MSQTFYYDYGVNRVSLPLERLTTDLNGIHYGPNVSNLGIQNIGWNDEGIRIVPGSASQPRNYRKAIITSLSSAGNSGAWQIQDYQLPILYNTDKIGFIVKDAITGEFHKIVHTIGSTLDSFVTIGSIDTHTVLDSIKMISITGSMQDQQTDPVIAMNFEVIYEENRRNDKLNIGYYGIDLYNQQTKTYDHVYENIETIDGIDYHLVPIGVYPGTADHSATSLYAAYNITLAYAIQNTNILLKIYVEKVSTPSSSWNISQLANFNNFGFHYGKADTNQINSKIDELEHSLSVVTGTVTALQRQVDTIVNNLGLMFDKFCSR